MFAPSHRSSYANYLRHFSGNYDEKRRYEYIDEQNKAFILEQKQLIREFTDRTDI